MPQEIEVKGLDELIASMTAYPNELNKIVGTSMQASLIALHQNVPPYPTVPNPVRQGTLGRSLGSSMEGGQAGTPSIYQTRNLGAGNFEGVFGTNLNYADYVIGEGQVWWHKAWFTMKTIASKAAAQIDKIWNDCGNQLAAFLEGKK